MLIALWIDSRMRALEILFDCIECSNDPSLGMVDSKKEGNTDSNTNRSSTREPPVLPPGCCRHNFWCGWHLLCDNRDKGWWLDRDPNTLSSVEYYYWMAYRRLNWQWWGRLGTGTEGSERAVFRQHLELDLRLERLLRWDSFRIHHRHYGPPLRLRGLCQLGWKDENNEIPQTSYKRDGRKRNPFGCLLAFTYRNLVVSFCVETFLMCSDIYRLASWCREGKIRSLGLFVCVCSTGGIHGRCGLLSFAFVCFLFVCLCRKEKEKGAESLKAKTDSNLRPSTRTPNNFWNVRPPSVRQTWGTGLGLWLVPSRV